jgi:hypothetical protein
LFLHQRNRKFVKRRCDHWKNSKTSKNCFLKKEKRKNVVWDLQSISRKSINLERERCESDSKSLCEEKVVWIDVAWKRSNFHRKKDWTI